jgi:16S rRNA C1402 (ribose-2'-O) methylase RsmI
MLTKLTDKQKKIVLYISPIKVNKLLNDVKFKYQAAKCKCVALSLESDHFIQ